MFAPQIEANIGKQRKGERSPSVRSHSQRTCGTMQLISKFNRTAQSGKGIGPKNTEGKKKEGTRLGPLPEKLALTGRLAPGR